jgi:hypothetical protein
MKNPLADKNATGRIWLSLVVLCTLILLAGYWLLQSGGDDSATSGLEPARTALHGPEIVVQSSLRDLQSETLRSTQGASVAEAPETLAPIDWQGAELKPWRGVVLSSRAARPLAGSQVEFRCERGLVQTQTDAKGRFELQLPVGQQGVLIARHEGFLERAKPNVRVGPQVSILLIPSASILGTFDGEATGLSAELFAMDSTDMGQPIQSTALEEDGGFRFSDLESGMYSVRIGPHVYAILKDVPVEAGEESLVHLVDLDPSQLLLGRVVVKQGGQAIANAQIYVGYHTLGIPRALERGTERTSFSDEEGQFEAFLGAGVRTNVRVVAPWGGEAALPYLDAEEWLKRGAVKVEIQAPARLAGRLEDLEGNGVLGVNVILCKMVSARGQKRGGMDRATRILGAATTNGEGEFDFGEVPSREDLIVLSAGARIEDSGFAQEQVLTQLKLKPGQHKTDLRLRLGLIARVAGQVLDKEGVPFEGVRLRVLNAGGETVASASSDVFGNYSMSEIPGGGDRGMTIELSLQEDVLHHERLKFPKRARGSVESVELSKDFKVTRKTVVSGWILDDEGYGVEGVRLSFTLQKGRKIPLGEGVSQQAGEFQFLIFEGQQGKVEVALRSRVWQLPKGVSRELLLPFPDPLIINVERRALEAGAQIRAEVLIEGSSEAVARLRIQNGRGGVLVAEGTRFSLRGIRPGRLRLSLRANGMANHLLPALDLTPGMDLDLGLIRMHRGCDLTLELVGVNGRLPKGSKIKLVGLSKYAWDPEWKAPTLDLVKSAKRQGSQAVKVTRRAIARGRWKLEAQIPGFKKVSQELNLRRPRGKYKITFIRK